MRTGVPVVLKNSMYKIDLYMFFILYQRPKIMFIVQKNKLLMKFQFVLHVPIFDTLFGSYNIWTTKPRDVFKDYILFWRSIMKVWRPILEDLRPFMLRETIYVTYLTKPHDVLMEANLAQVKKGKYLFN